MKQYTFSIENANVFFVGFLTLIGHCNMFIPLHGRMPLAHSLAWQSKHNRFRKTGAVQESLGKHSWAEYDRLNLGPISPLRAYLNRLRALHFAVSKSSLDSTST